MQTRPLSQAELQARWPSLVVVPPDMGDAPAPSVCREVMLFEDVMLRVGDDVEFSSVQQVDNKRGLLQMFLDRGRVLVTEHRVKGATKLCRPHMWQIRRVYREGVEVIRQAGLILPPVPLPLDKDARWDARTQKRCGGRTAARPTKEMLLSLPTPCVQEVQEGDVVAYRGHGRKEVRVIVMLVCCTPGMQDVVMCRYRGNSGRFQVKFAEVRKVWRHHHLVAIREDVRAEEMA